MTGMKRARENFGAKGGEGRTDLARYLAFQQLQHIAKVVVPTKGKKREKEKRKRECVDWNRDFRTMWTYKYMCVSGVYTRSEFIERANKRNIEKGRD